jgi:hypothetical protein
MNCLECAEDRPVVHEIDFCEECGRRLHCVEDEPCSTNENGEHVFICQDCRDDAMLDILHRRDYR